MKIKRYHLGLQSYDNINIFLSNNCTELTDFKMLWIRQTFEFWKYILEKFSKKNLPFENFKMFLAWITKAFLNCRTG